MDINLRLHSKRITKLFNEAQKHSATEYIFSLARVEGLTHGIIDPIIKLQSSLKNFNEKKINNNELIKKYQSTINSIELLKLFCNLFNNSNGKLYNMVPFQHLTKGEFPNIIQPTTLNIIQDLIKITKDTQYGDISAVFMYQYIEIKSEIEKLNDPSKLLTNIRYSLIRIIKFTILFLKVYQNKKLEFNSRPRYYKLPGFMVLESLSNKKNGLIGFKMHFSNGSHAKFVRRRDSTDSLNFSPGVSLGFLVGDRNKLVDAWKVGEKHLFELGLKGKYNKTGEWKPLVFPGKTEQIEKEIKRFSSDPEIQAQYFYMFCTGYNVIEFVIAMNIELPMEDSIFGENIYLHKCSDHEKHKDGNSCIYDCWLELDSIDADNIEYSIHSIGIAINRISFTYGIKAKWCLKYGQHGNQYSKAVLKKDDINVLNVLMKNFPLKEEGYIIDTAIEWYNNGKTSNNIFTSFISYYIALESVALAIFSDKIRIGHKFIKRSKTQKKILREKCIESYYNEFYSTDLSKFVRESYFNCIVGLKEKTQRVLEIIFGKEHEYIALLFTKNDGFSLSDIRSKIVHGEFSALDKDERTIVKDSLYDLSLIVEEFIKRIILKLKPDEEIPDWSQMHNTVLHLSDPRSTTFATRDDIFPTKNWKIRESWIS